MRSSFLLEVLLCLGSSLECKLGTPSLLVLRENSFQCHRSLCFQQARQPRCSQLEQDASLTVLATQSLADSHTTWRCSGPNFAFSSRTFSVFLCQQQEKAEQHLKLGKMPGVGIIEGQDSCFCHESLTSDTFLCLCVCQFLYLQGLYSNCRFND